MSATAAAEHPARHEPVRWPDDVAVGRASVAKVGMWVFLLSDALMFAAFLIGYGILRGGAPAVSIAGTEVSTWLCSPEISAATGCRVEPILGINFTAALTFLLICSSVTMVLALAAATDKDRKGTLRFLGLTILFGVLFLCGQFEEYFGIVGHGLAGEGLWFGYSQYATTFYVITSFHGLHVFSGVVLLSMMWIRTAMGKYDGGRTDHIEVVGLFWHFVDLVWILVFTFVYLI